ncbi:hypothetical protein GCM10017673_46030 [Streptosporangium violaceochromogenes]|nr:hypothetical protein GCM10017673_46030 [Streptosporangium violaceochromogenes]
MSPVESREARDFPAETAGGEREGRGAPPGRRLREAGDLGPGGQAVWHYGNIPGGGVLHPRGRREGKTA